MPGVPATACRNGQTGQIDKQSIVDCVTPLYHIRLSIPVNHVISGHWGRCGCLVQATNGDTKMQIPKPAILDFRDALAIHAGRVTVFVLDLRGILNERTSETRKNL